MTFYLSQMPKVIPILIISSLVFVSPMAFAESSAKAPLEAKVVSGEKLKKPTAMEKSYSSQENYLTAKIKFLAQKIGKIEKSNSSLDLADYAEALVKRGLFVDDDQDIAKAVRAAKRSLELINFGNTKAMLVLAKERSWRHNFAGSIQIVNQVLKQDPKNKSAMLMLASNLRALGYYSQAVAALDILIKRNPSQEALIQRALTLSDQGKDWVQVNQAFEKAMEKTCSSENQCGFYTGIYMREAMRHGKSTKAKTILLSAIAKGHRHEFMTYLEAKMAANEGRMADAIRLLKTISHGALSERAGLLVAIYEYTQSPTDETRKIMSEYKEGFKEDIAAGRAHHLDLALVQLTLGEQREAVKTMKEEASKRGHWMVKVHLGFALSELGQSEASKKALQPYKNRKIVKNWIDQSQSNENFANKYIKALF